MRARNMWYAAALAAIPVALTGSAQADHINANTQTSGSVVIQPAQPPVVIQPGQSVVVQPGPNATVVAPGPQMVQAEDLEANEVRAQTIYANKIEASEIQGSIHQTAKVKLDGSVRDMRVPTVVASVLYADTIKAHRVVADHIFVRELERR
jgi:hypothetical protein